MGYHPSGVSVNTSTEFVRPGGNEGDELVGISQVVKIGTLHGSAHLHVVLSSLRLCIWFKPLFFRHKSSLYPHNVLRLARSHSRLWIAYKAYGRVDNVD